MPTEQELLQAAREGDEESARFYQPTDFVGVVAGIAPLFFSITRSTAGSYLDYVALGGGGIAAVMGLLAWVSLTRTPKSVRGKRALIATLLVALAAVQILRGFGVILFRLFG